MTMTLSEELQWRGFVNQSTFTDLSVIDEKKPKFYMGFDASADSQAVGNLAALMFVKTFLRHQVPGVLLAGGSTSLIGDPGGKDIERPLQDEATIAHNVERAQEQLRSILQGHEFELVNNLDWTRDMTVIPFLRDIGKYFSMTPLVQRDYIASRIGEGGAGISYTEFSYTILQGMDYLHLFDEKGVTLQLGGSDQWGNCLSGVELIRKARGAEVDVITLNLVINKATGKKFGKSEDGAVWLDAAKTSVYKFYQFWLNSDDESVEGYLKIFTELDKSAVDEVMEQFNADRASRLAQKTLAYEVTKLVHGQAKADSVVRITAVLFSGAELSTITSEDIDELKSELPTIHATAGELLLDVLATAGIASSKGEARRLMEQGGVYMNGRNAGPDYVVTQDDRQAAGSALVRKGKNTYVVLDITA